MLIWVKSIRFMIFLNNTLCNLQEQGFVSLGCQIICIFAFNTPICKRASAQKDLIVDSLFITLLLLTLFVGALCLVLVLL